LVATEAYQSMLEENEKVALSINGVFKRSQAFSAASVLFRMWEDRPFDDIMALSSLSNKALVLYTTRDELHPISVAERIHDALADSSIQELAPRYYENERYTEELREAVATFLKI